MKQIELYRNEDETLKNAYDRAVVEIHLKKRLNGYRSILLCGTEPKAGTTTISINLAISLAASGWKTLLIDCDMRKRSEYKRLNDTVEFGLSDYLSSKTEFADIIYPTNWKLLHYIPCGSFDERAIRLLCSARMDEMMNQLYKVYDFIIYDMPALSTVPDVNVMAVKCDGVILVAAIGQTEKSSLYDAKVRFEEIGAKTIGTIVNKTPMDEYKKHLRNYDYFSKEQYNKKKRKS